jgi:phage tail sheath protein FI
MPVTPTYPGVYIEEVPSGVRTITGVATSIAAFVGRALRGPTDTPVVVNGFADFERVFGGLWVDSALGFAVRDFFLNGGGQAIVVRLYAGEAAKAKSKVSVGTLKLEAAYPGKWGANLRATVDTEVSEEVATRLGLQKADLYNLTVRDAGPGGTTERFLNVSHKNSARRIDKILKDESRLVAWEGTSEPEFTFDPNAAIPTVAILAAEKALKDAQAANPPVPADIETAKTNLANAKKAAVDPVTKAEAALKDAQAANPSVPADIAAAKAALANAKKTAEDAVSDGTPLDTANFLPANGELNKKGLYTLEKADLFNILCLPPYLDQGGEPSQDVDPSLVGAAAAYCEKRRAMLIVDPRSGWKDKTITLEKFLDPNADNVGTRSKNAALFFPRLKQPNPLRGNQLEEFAPCGAVAGVFARTDTQRGVWKAPAGLDAALAGVPQLSVPLTDQENGELNPHGINCLRFRPGAGRVVWGSRTLQGDDILASEWKYIPVRRMALFLEESLYRGTQWVVFEPNDEPLWAQIRLNVGAFLHNLFRQGAFQGKTPQEAYFVKCDKTTTTQNDINLGIVNIAVGFAPLKPAEFVIIKIQQLAGQTSA